MNELLCEQSVALFTMLLYGMAFWAGKYIVELAHMLFVLAWFSTLSWLRGEEIEVEIDDDDG